MNHHLKRLGRTLLAAGATSALALTMTTAPAEAYRTKAGDNAASFLAKRLVAHGNKLVTTSGGVAYPAWGQTLDAYFALRSEGVHSARATYVYKNVGAHAKEYISYGTDHFAGATGKLLTAAVVEKANVANVGGVNLVNRMKSLMAPDGQFKDKYDPENQYSGNYANTIGQSFAIIGLRRATGTVDARAVAALRKAQCPNGGFRLDLDGGGTSYTGAQLACTSNAGAQADATAYAVQALYTVPSTVNKAAANKALNYLAIKQAANGGFYALGSYNTNTTGVAAAAFHVGGRITDRNQAIAFIKGRQFGCTFPSPLRGGIAYDAARYNEARGQGAAAEVSEQDERATAQATWGLSGLRFQTLSISGSGTATPAVTC